MQKGVFLSTKHEARHMVANERGSAIVNIASFNARMPMMGGSPYVTGKAGVEMFSKNAALELSQHGSASTRCYRDSSTPHSSRASPAGSRC